MLLRIAIALIVWIVVYLLLTLIFTLLSLTIYPFVVILAVLAGIVAYFRGSI